MYSSTNIQAFANFLKNVIFVTSELKPAAIYHTNTTKDEDATPQPDLLNMMSVPIQPTRCQAQDEQLQRAPRAIAFEISTAEFCISATGLKANADILSLKSCSASTKN